MSVKKRYENRKILALPVLRVAAAPTRFAAEDNIVIQVTTLDETGSPLEASFCMSVECAERFRECVEAAIKAIPESNRIAAQQN